MNSNKLSVKEYLIINFIIFLLVTFLGGFFVGAKLMEKQLNNSVKLNMSINHSNFTEKEMIDFYYQAFSPVRGWYKEVQKFVNEKENMDPKKLRDLKEEGIHLKETLITEVFNSEYLMDALVKLQEHVDLSIQALDASEETKQELNDQAYLKYLQSQKQLYRNIWVWEQFIQNKSPIKDESLLDWAQWKKANLHQKNYIITAVLEKKAILTYQKPEDITVHIDAYLQTNKEPSMDLDEVLLVLISSASVHNQDFLKYTDWYPGVILPKIPNFTES